MNLKETEVVMAAVKVRPNSLCSSDELKNDKGIVLETVKQDPK